MIDRIYPKETELRLDYMLKTLKKFKEVKKDLVNIISSSEITVDQLEIIFIEVLEVINNRKKELKEGVNPLRELLNIDEVINKN